MYLYRSELTEVSRSRDAWASHTTLQSSAIQHLLRENNHLKEEFQLPKHSHTDSVEKSVAEEEENKERREREEGGGVSIGRSKDILESTEKELFETKLQLKAKVQLL